MRRVQGRARARVEDLHESHSGGRTAQHDEALCRAIHRYVPDALAQDDRAEESARAGIKDTYRGAIAIDDKSTVYSCVDCYRTRHLADENGLHNIGRGAPHRQRPSQRRQRPYHRQEAFLQRSLRSHPHATISNRPSISGARTSISGHATFTHPVP